MLYDRTKFFTVIRTTLPVSKTLTQQQVDGFNNLLKEGEARGISTEWIAYVLATAWHETAATMQPVRETLALSDAQAIANLNRFYPNVKNKYWLNGYFGRGYVQLTWDYNYKVMGNWLGVDLYNNPSMALDPIIAAKIIYEGMIRGMFTAKKLADYLDNVLESDEEEYAEYARARAIVNGSDKASLISGYALKIQKALKGAEMVAPVSLGGLKLSATEGEDAPQNAIPIDQPPQASNGSFIQSTTVWASVGAFMTTVVTSLSGLTPVVQIVLLLLAFGFLFWIIFQRIKGNNAIDRVI